MAFFVLQYGIGEFPPSNEGADAFIESLQYIKEFSGLDLKAQVDSLSVGTDTFMGKLFRLKDEKLDLPDLYVMIYRGDSKIIYDSIEGPNMPLELQDEFEIIFQMMGYPKSMEFRRLKDLVIYKVPGSTKSLNDLFVQSARETIAAVR